MDKVDLRQQIQSALSKLHTLRDDIRVRLHLAGMDLNDKWDELELRFEKAERAAEHGSAAAFAALHELLGKFEELRAKLGHGEPLGGAKKAAS